MKLKKSILGGGIAQDLLKDLDGKPLHHVARFNSNGADLSFALRRSYRTGSSKWTGTTLLVKHEATGGMFLTAHGYAGYSWAQTYSKTYRLAPAQVARAEHYLCMAITRMCRDWATERQRLEVVNRLDKAAAPHIKNPCFLEWVEQREKSVGESDYGKLTVAQAEDWIRAIEEWVANNPFTSVWSQASK
jgi:hypothetical protein